MRARRSKKERKPPPNGIHAGRNEARSVQNEPSKGRNVVVVGAGGNIGSHLVPHLARMADVERVVLIDRGVYEAANLSSQEITPCDVGKAKVGVQARRLRRINPALRIEAIADAVERVPLGLLRADVILACLDTRLARQWVNQCAWRLGVPWIDAGVDAGGLLARVNVYLPGPDNPCLECAWDERDYTALEQAYPCSGVSEESFPTNAPSSLGALAASLQAIESEKILRGERAGVGKQILIDAAHHRHFITTFRRAPMCRFAGHAVWQIKRLTCAPEEMTLEDALRLGVNARINGEQKSLSVEGVAFVFTLRCLGCGHAKKLLRLESSLNRCARTCRRCGRQMIAAGLDRLEKLISTNLSSGMLARSLSSVGFRLGDVFTVSEGRNEIHYEITGHARSVR